MENLTKDALSIPEVIHRSGLGRTTIYEAIRSGNLIARKHGRRTIILRTDFLRWLEGLPTLEAA